MLQSYFTKLFDRRAFAQGMQSLREAAELNVPLNLYTIRPVSQTSSSSKPAQPSPPSTPVTDLPPPSPPPPPQPPVPPTGTKESRL
jgi:hypothetical protein